MSFHPTKRPRTYGGPEDPHYAQGQLPDTPPSTPKDHKIASTVASVQALSDLGARSVLVYLARLLPEPVIRVVQWYKTHEQTKNEREKDIDFSHYMKDLADWEKNSPAVCMEIIDKACKEIAEAASKCHASYRTRQSALQTLVKLAEDICENLMGYMFSSETWQEAVLSILNSMSATERQILTKSKDGESTFIQLLEELEQRGKETNIPGLFDDLTAITKLFKVEGGGEENSWAENQTDTTLQARDPNNPMYAQSSAINNWNESIPTDVYTAPPQHPLTNPLSPIGIKSHPPQYYSQMPQALPNYVPGHTYHQPRTLPPTSMSPSLPGYLAHSRVLPAPWFNIPQLPQAELKPFRSDGVYIYDTAGRIVQRYPQPSNPGNGTYQ